MLSYIFSSLIPSILHNSSFTWVICVCVHLLTPGINSPLYPSFSMHDTQNCELMGSESPWTQNQHRAEGKDFSQENLPPSLTSDFTIFTWVFLYFTPFYQLWKWSKNFWENLHVCVFAQVKYHITQGDWQNVTLPKIHIELVLQTHWCVKEKVLVQLPRES